MTSNDQVNHPSHYFADNGMEAIDVIEAFFHDNYFLGNVFKYIARAGKKDSVLQDLKKAKVYLDREIERVYEQQTADDNEVIRQKINELLNEPQPGYLYTTPPKTKFAWVEDLVQPREYASLCDVPDHVVVWDKDGDYWSFDADGNRWISFDEGENWDPTDPCIEDSGWDYWAPFTEVMDD